LDKAIEINPQDAEAWNKKGDALKSIGRNVEAEAAFARAVDLGSTAVEASEDTATDMSDISSIVLSMFF
jgi:Flp pilus assembly protein TadD